MHAKPTVMICDDEADLLHMYSLALKKHYNVLTAKSGRACVEKYMEQSLQGKKIHLLLLDYKLGDTTGDDVARKIRDLDGTKTILISAYELGKEMLDDLRSNDCIVGVISKPVSMKILLEKIGQTLT